MNPILVVIVVIFIGGILYLTNPFAETKETREQYLEKLRTFLEGRMEPVEGKESSHKIYFKYYERQFLYEDIIEVGFSKQVNNAYLKSTTNKDLDLNFEPFSKEGIIHTEALIVSKLNSSLFNEKIKIKVPDELKVFKINTSDPIQAKVLIEDPKIGRILAYYKDSDVKGHHRMSLKIKKGVIIVNFHPAVMRHPSLFSLHSNIHHIEEHLEKLSVLAQAIDKVQS